MAQANQAIAIKHFSDTHGLDFGLRDAYEASQLLRFNDLWELLHPDLQQAIKDGFTKDRIEELKEG